MTSGTILVSTAYFPPVSYVSLINGASKVLVEKEENYIKQTYRNRCRIYSANGPMNLTVPILEGSFHKRPVKDIMIDYSKRWQLIHIGAIVSAYRSSPYFEYYYSDIETVIMGNHKFLIDLNMHSLKTLLKAAGISVQVENTDTFIIPGTLQNDFRYSLKPKNSEPGFVDGLGKYTQVFSDRGGFIPDLSILDLVFNTGPDARDYLLNLPFSGNIRT